MKSPVFFFVLFIANFQLSSQCLTLSNCPTSPPTFGDLTINDPQFWQEANWYDPTYGTHDLAEMPVDLSIQVTDNCGAGNVQVSFVLFLDLDGSGGSETVVSSAALSGTDPVLMAPANNGSTCRPPLSRRLEYTFGGCKQGQNSGRARW